MNKTHDELCQEVTMLRDQLEQSNEQKNRLAHRLQETSDMLTNALTLAEESAARCRALKESRPTEIANAVVRARRDWAAQARLRPTAVERWGEMMQLTFENSRIASEFEESVKPAGGET